MVERLHTRDEPIDPSALGVQAGRERSRMRIDPARRLSLESTRFKPTVQVDGKYNYIAFTATDTEALDPSLSGQLFHPGRLLAGTIGGTKHTEAGRKSPVISIYCATRGNDKEMLALLVSPRQGLDIVRSCLKAHSVPEKDIPKVITGYMSSRSAQSSEAAPILLVEYASYKNEQQALENAAQLLHVSLDFIRGLPPGKQMGIMYYLYEKKIASGAPEDEIKAIKLLRNEFSKKWRED